VGAWQVHLDFLNALRLVYPWAKQVLSVDLPSGGRVSLAHQPARRRYCAHLLYGPPMVRGGRRRTSGAAEGH